MARTTFETKTNGNSTSTTNADIIFPEMSDASRLTEEEQVAAALAASLEEAKRDEERRQERRRAEEEEDARVRAQILAVIRQTSARNDPDDDEDDEKRSEILLNEENECENAELLIDQNETSSDQVEEQSEDDDDLQETNPFDHLMSWNSTEDDREAIDKKMVLRSGLKNLGNSCFLNGTLQCLASIAPLTQLFLSFDANEGNDSRCFPWNAHNRLTCPQSRLNKFCALCECIDLFPKMVGLDSSSSGNKKWRRRSLFLKPSVLFHNLPKLNDCLRPGRQEDAHELMSSLIDAWEESLKNEAMLLNPISELVHGRICTTTRCGKCLSRSVREEAFSILSLDVASSMNESLTLFSTAELLRGEDAYFCDLCDSKKIASKTSVISKCPPVLIVHLKRFKMEYNREDWSYSYSKIEDFESFPFCLEMNDCFCVGEGEEEYELTGVLVHCGSTLGSGHYYANVLGRDGRWYKCNDDTVTRVTEKQVAKEEAYILVYKRKGGTVGGGNWMKEKKITDVVGKDEGDSELDGELFSGDDFEIESSASWSCSSSDGSSVDEDSFEHVAGLLWRGGGGFENGYLRGDWVV